MPHLCHTSRMRAHASACSPGYFMVATWPSQPGILSPTIWTDAASARYERGEQVRTAATGRGTVSRDPRQNLLYKHGGISLTVPVPLCAPTRPVPAGLRLGTRSDRRRGQRRRRCRRRQSTPPATNVSARCRPLGRTPDARPTCGRSRRVRTPGRSVDGGGERLEIVHYRAYRM